MAFFVTAAAIAAVEAAAIAAAEAAAVAAAEAAAVTAAETAAVTAAETAAVAPGGIAATGSSSLGSLGTGIVETAGETAGEKILEQGAKKGIEQLGRKAAEETTKETVKRSALEVAKDSNDQLLTKLPQYQPKAPPSSQGINVAGDIPSGGINMTAPKTPPAFPEPPPAFPEPPPAQPNLFSVPEPKPILRSVSPEFSPMNRSIGGGDKIVVETKVPNNAYIPDVKAPFNPRGGLETINPAKNTVSAAEPLSKPGADAWAQSIADKGMTSLDKAGEWAMNNKMNIALGGLGLMQMMPPSSGVNPISESMIRPYTYSEEDTSDQEADPRGREKIRYSSSYAAGTPYKAAQGGLLSLHRGGNFLSGGGDGMSDDIPAMIGAKQPARLADGEFVIPADVVSHLGNGSSKAGAAKLYAMMDKIRQERTGRKRQSPQINAAKYLPR